MSQCGLSHQKGTQIMNPSSPVAMITGGGTGIGRATALRLAQEGYVVALTGRRPEPLIEAAHAVQTAGGVATFIPGEVSRPEDAERATAETIDAHGRLDVLVCNHGVGDAAPAGDDTLEGWERTLRINLTGAFLMARAALPHLLDQRGSVVTVSSTSGWLAGPGWASYCASKARLIMLTRCLANDYGPRGLRANCVCPGWVRLRALLHRDAALAAAGAGLEDLLDGASGEVALGDEAERGAFGDEVGEVVFSMRGDQDELRRSSADGARQRPREIEAAVAAEVDVDQDDLRLELSRAGQAFVD